MAKLAPRSPFRSRPAEPAPEPAPEPVVTEPGPRKKGAPTPTRRQAEAARRERLHPTLTPKQQKALERQQRTEENRRATAAIDNTPLRVLARDFLDSRFHIGEVALPMLIAIAFVTFLLPQTTFFTYVAIALSWSLILLVAIDAWWTWRKFKQLARARYPRESLRGMGFYVFNRLIQLRPLRSPKPRVKMGENIS